MSARRWWGWATEIDVTESGYFHCPACDGRRPTGVHRGRRRFYVGLLPVHTRVLAPFYRCADCGGEYPAEEGHGFDFSDRAAPSTWACFKCGGEAPGHVFTCPHCGFSLNRSVESLSGSAAERPPAAGGR